MSDEELFEQVLDGISNDRFLAFVEQYTHSLISPFSPKFLPWCAEALPADGEKGTGPSPAPAAEDTAGRELPLVFSVAHYLEFQTYASLFESRILSVLRRHPSRLSPEDFYGLCAAHVSFGNLALEDGDGGGISSAGENRVTSSTTGVAPRQNSKSGGGDNSAIVTANEMCAAILDMVVAVSSFESFAKMLAERQRRILVTDDASSGSSGIGSDADES